MSTSNSSPDLPIEVWQVLDRSITVEYTSLTGAGTPVMVPVTPYVADDRSTLDVSTGLTYPAKAERARRDPKVSLLYSDPLGSGLVRPPVVLVQGLATVRDANLQANTDRYVRLTMEKVPAAYRGQPRFLLRTLDWYFSRIWIQVTPVRVWWWDSATMTTEPGQWAASAGTTAPPSARPRQASSRRRGWSRPPTGAPPLRTSSSDSTSEAWRGSTRTAFR
jgi:hypothetical protein